jgi:hypothetical protein
MKKWMYIVGGFILFLAVCVFFYLQSSKGKKMLYAKTISKKTGRHFKDYLGMDEGYLKSRAEAVKNNSTTFTYNGVYFNTASGTKI